MASPPTITPTITNLLLTKGLPLLPPTPLNPHAPLGKWLLATSTLVFSIVHIGGITRLTKSGLSMTDWKPLGSRPPISEEEWTEEFERYKTFPEWEQRKNMTLEEFKYIFYWEWGHRMLGRAAGVVFVVPWVYFSWIHRPSLPSSPSISFSSLNLTPPKPVLSAIPPGYQSRLALLCAMGGTQGLVGWWMVRSGLGEDRRGDRKEIRVSPYRLAAHLGMAVGTYSLLVWTGLGALSYPIDFYAASGAGTASATATSAAAAANTAASAANASKPSLSLLQQYTKKLTSNPTALRHAQILRTGTIHTVALTGLTILSGAFVAGNDAGNAYNTYPLMNDRLIPWEDMVDEDLMPRYRNFFENTATVQWNHRVWGTTTAVAAVGLAGYGLLHPAGRITNAANVANLANVGKSNSPSLSSLPSTTPQVRRGLLALGTAATAQMSLGIATLLHYVPITLAASHQLGSLVVLTCGIYTAHSLRYAGKSVIASVGGVGSTVGKSAMSAAGGVVGGARGGGGVGSGGGVVNKGVAVASRVINMKL